MSVYDGVRRLYVPSDTSGLKSCPGDITAAYPALIPGWRSRSWNTPAALGAETGKPDSKWKRVLTMMPGEIGEPQPLIISDSTPIDIGSEEKYRVTGHIIDLLGTASAVSLVEKIPARKSAEQYYTVWDTFRTVGLPVVPWMRTTSRGSVIMPDLATDGGQFYGYGFLRILCDLPDPDLYTPTAFDASFKQLLTPLTLKNIKQQTFHYADIADDYRLALPMSDPFELFLHPDNSK